MTERNKRGRCRERFQTVPKILENLYIVEKSMKLLSEGIVEWIKDIVRSSGAGGIVIGLSGGIDSAVAAALCKKAVGEKILALVIPCHSEPCALSDSERVTGAFGIKTEKVDLTAVYDLLVSVLPSSNKFANANLKPRLRMTVLYHYAKMLNCLVAGTGNRTEIEIGYFTKYGDGAADFMPLAGLLKRDVRSLACELGVPEEIINKPPTADLWKGQTDEGEIGISYEELDDIIFSLGTGKEEKLSHMNLAKVRKLIECSEHKRKPVPKFIP